MRKVSRSLGIKCFTCHKELSFKDIKGLKVPVSLDLSCKKCRGDLLKSSRLGPFTRNCPGCNKQITHTTKKGRNNLKNNDKRYRMVKNWYDFCS